MNIFILDYDINKNAQFHCNKHIVKMPLELAQMISTTYHVLEYTNLPDFIFSKASYINHPCTKWVRKNRNNFNYTCKLGLALYNEYQYRYNKPDKMQRVKQIFEYGLKHNPFPILNSCNKNITPFALAMPDKYKTNDVVESYRNYYLGEKEHLFKWTKRDIPHWITKGNNNV